MGRASIATLFLFLALLASGCANKLVKLGTTPATIGTKSSIYDELTSLPRPKERLVVAVYQFRDQTGQYKTLPAATSFSTAVTQGATSILIKSLEDSGWFIPIEREGLPNLLNERKILRSTRENYQHLMGQGNNKILSPLPPLLYAGVILEGGIIAYETNVITGGVGVRYFGLGGSGEVRRDQISVYLRAVAVKTGRVLKTVSTTKTILSKEVDVGIFRFVRHRRLLEVETGFTTNEPIQMCVMEAIDKAVHDLIIEGVLDNIWELENVAEVNSPVIRAYCEEKSCVTNKVVRGPQGQLLAGKTRAEEGRLGEKEPSPPELQAAQKPVAPLTQSSRKPVSPQTQSSREPVPPAPQSSREAAPPREVRQAQTSPVPSQVTPVNTVKTSKAVAYEVAPGDGGLRQIVAGYYPDNKKFGYCAVILANHQIYNEDQISPGQNLKLPQVDKNDHVITYKNKHYYIYKLYYDPAQAKQAVAKLKGRKIRFFVRQTWLPDSGPLYRIFLGGYESREDLTKAIALAERN